MRPDRRCLIEVPGIPPSSHSFVREHSGRWSAKLPPTSALGGSPGGHQLDEYSEYPNVTQALYIYKYLCFLRDKSHTP
ncbi:hypothetical protein TNCV_511871 [Trichonephila clavipes]|nr:hypothetical protein TNCV_511871 [Trichonephila clavipes]